MESIPHIPIEEAIWAQVDYYSPIPRNAFEEKRSAGNAGGGEG
jgi:hypothetical protein